MARPIKAPVHNPEVQAFIPFSHWLPDKGHLRNPGLVAASDFLRYGDHWAPMAGIGKRGTGMTPVPVVKGCHLNEFWGDSGFEIVVGTDDKLYEVLTPSGNWNFNEVTRTSGGNYTVQDEGWSFAQFGGHILAAPGDGDELQVFLGDGATDFVDCITSSNPPRPKFVSVWGSRVAIGHTGSLLSGAAAAYQAHRKTLVWMSATDNARVFGTTSSHLGDRTDFFPILDDYGPITALAGTSEFGYVFKAGCIYRANFKAPHGGVDFQIITEANGTIYHRSIVKVNGEIYFWGINGPSVIRGGQVLELGDGSIMRALVDTNWVSLTPDPEMDASTHLDRGSIQGAYDPSSRCMIWMYPGGSVDQMLLFYNLSSGAFSVSDIGDFGSGSFDSIQAICGLSRYSEPKSGLDFPDGTVLFGDDAITSEFHSLQFGAGNSLVSHSDSYRFTTGFSELSPGKRTRVTGVRSVHSVGKGSSSDPRLIVSVSVKDRPYEDVKSTKTIDTNTSAPDRRGWISFQGSGSKAGALTQISVRYPDGSDGDAELAEVEGIEVRFRVEGKT